MINWARTVVKGRDVSGEDGGRGAAQELHRQDRKAMARAHPAAIARMMVASTMLL